MVTARDGWASRWLRNVGFALLGAGCVLSSGDVAFVFLVAVVGGLALVLLHREREPARQVSDQAAAFESRMRTLAKSRSMLNMVLLDEGEDFSTQAQALSGYSEPTGPAPRDPWETVCGLLCRETDDPPTLAADLDAVTCERCRQSRLWRALDRAREGET